MTIENIVNPSEIERKSPITGRKLTPWRPSVTTPILGQEASSISLLTTRFLQEIRNPNTQLAKYRDVALDPVAKSSITIKSLRLRTAFGKYRHPDEQVNKWVNQMINLMDGTLPEIVSLVGTSAFSEGAGLAEIVFDNKTPGYRNLWRVKKLVPLDISRVRFKGKDGNIDTVIYTEKGGTEKRIPYSKCIHITNNYASHENNPYGHPENKVAYPYVLGKKAILAEMLVAAKNSASGIWVGKADSNETVQLIDSKGSPLGSQVPAPVMLHQQLSKIENGGFVVTDIKNSLERIPFMTNDALWSNMLMIMDNGIRLSYGVPKLIFDEGSTTFFSNTGKHHLTVLDSQIEGLLSQIKDQLIEKVIRPILLFNFGITDDFGEFDYKPSTDNEASMSKAGMLLSLLNTPGIPNTNLTIVNAIYELLGLPAVTPEQQAAQMRDKFAYDIVSNKVMMGEDPFAPQQETPQEPTK
jgi:hypothetical protein